MKEFNMERKIGDVIEYDGQKFQIMKGTCTCENCYFREKSFLECARVVEELGCCEIETSTHIIDIYYKLIEE